MSGGKNCYPESDVLINKYNIRDKELLEKLQFNIEISQGGEDTLVLGDLSCINQLFVKRLPIRPAGLKLFTKA